MPVVNGVSSQVFPYILMIFPDPEIMRRNITIQCLKVQGMKFIQDEVNIDIIDRDYMEGILFFQVFCQMSPPVENGLKWPE